MEVAAGDSFIIIREDNRVIGNRVYLSGNGIIDIVDSVPACAVYLRSTAECICVLNLTGYGIMCKFTAVQKGKQIFSRIYLTLMAAELMDFRIVCFLYSI